MTQLLEINLQYKKEYIKPESNPIPMSEPTGSDGQFPKEKEILQEATTDSSIIDSNANVQAFIKYKEEQYIDEYSNVECKIRIGILGKLF